MSEPRAWVEEVDGQIVLHDPDAVAVVQVLNKQACYHTYMMQQERVAHFAERMAARGDDPGEVVITLINVDDPHGGPLAEALMPGHDWQAYRDRGEVPFARGLAERRGIKDVLDIFAPEAAQKLEGLAGKVCCVVVDYTTAEVYEVGAAPPTWNMPAPV